MDLDEMVTEAITRLLGGASKLCVRSYSRNHIPGESEFVAIAWLGGRESRLDFVWLKQESADPYFYQLQSEEAPVEAFVTIDEAILHTDRLAQRALEEEAADAEAEQAAAATYTEVKARLTNDELKVQVLRPGDFVIKT
jgi:hypothetical protein